MSRMLGRLAAVVCVGLCLAGVGLAEETGTAASPPGTEEAARERPPASASSGGYSYNPGGRRDPFVSLLLGRSPKGPVRRQGLLGQLISEVDLVGIAKDAQGYMAMVRGSDQKTYFVRVGAELADGKIIDIQQNKVIFREEIKDPFSLKPYRDIVKPLTPGGEE